jgi:hypothetical protein
MTSAAAAKNLQLFRCESGTSDALSSLETLEACEGVLVTLVVEAARRAFCGTNSTVAINRYPCFGRVST